MNRDKPLSVGVLAVQGAFEEHAAMLGRLGADPFLLRKRADADRKMDALVLPGGESTVQGKLLRELDMLEPLRQKISAGLPVMGTCAGMILLAKTLENDAAVYFGLMDITVRRNAYGRQLGSFTAKERFADQGETVMPFIRAPYIAAAGPGTEILAEVNGKAVAARQKNMLALSFHPEVTQETTVHRYFLNMAYSAGQDWG
ncbi:MAG: pyridoxal 5'-phosphate synthase glutaminase subunit PdxT [Oscillospiraceae bacterium]|nr:pyridoxal 5'-phosphate synthase glutaminase subunit PdxT [Oscillospiraceae bacterium]